MPSAPRLFSMLFALLVCHSLADSVRAQKLQRPRDGVYQVFDPVRKFLVLEEFYKDGLRHGTSRTFDSQGIIREANYKEGKLDGFWREYEKGNLASEKFYKSGEPEGATFVERSDYKMNGQYVDGKKEGHWSEERKGHWQLVANYKNGLLDGPWQRTSAKGKKVVRLKYEMGKLVSSEDDLKDFPYLQKVSQLAAAGKDPMAERAMAFLQSDVDLDYPQTPLKEVLEDLKERFCVPLFVEHSLADTPRIVNQPITIDHKSIPIFLGLNEIVAEYGLTFDYRFHSFWLTTPKGAEEWKDPTGISDLKPAEGSTLAKALAEPMKSRLAISLAELPKAIQGEYGFELDVSRLDGAKWHPPEIIFSDRPGISRPEFRDILFLALYQNKCHCREEGGKLILERIAK